MRYLPTLLAVALCAGCASKNESGPPIVDPTKSMTFLEAGFRPEVLLFPEFLLMEDFELHQHGRIPETRLVAAGMNSSLGLASVRMRFSEALGEAGWSMGKVEMAKQSFRMLATLGVEELEIRAVQGGADTQVFLLYLPPPPAVDVPMDMNGRTL